MTLPSPTPDKMPFTPPHSAILINSLWFLSLAFSLTCALTATLVKQWSKDYLKNTRRSPTPYVRARIRAFLFEGLLRFRMSAVVDAIPLLLHTALLLFFTGLYEFLRPINPFISTLTFGIAMAFATLYTIITVSATFFRNCPYTTPLSRRFYDLLQRTSWLLALLLKACKRPVSVHLKNIPSSATKMMEGVAMGKALGWFAFDLTSPRARDRDALRWTVESLTSNRELEPFVEGIPGFLVANDMGHADEILWDLLGDRCVVLGQRIGLLLSSCNDVLEPIGRQRRALACITAIWSLTLSALQSTKIWYSGFEASALDGLEQRLTDLEPVTAGWARSTLAVVLCRVLQDMWASSAGTAETGLHQDVEHLLRTVNTAQRCAKAVSPQAAERWEPLSKWVSSLSADVEEHSGSNPNLEDKHRKRFVELLKDARLLSLVNLIVVLMANSFDPFTLIKRPKERHTPVGTAPKSQYHVLRHLRRDLTARSRDLGIQAYLLETVSAAIGTEERKGGQMKIHPLIIEELLSLVGTVDEPGKAKDIVRRYQIMRTDSAAAANAMNALDAPRDWVMVGRWEGEG
jgi:hypothetical protein